MADTYTTTDERTDFRPLQRRALIVGGVAAVLLVIGAFLDSTQFFRSYLFGWLLWTGVAVGGLALALLHNLTGGAWGMVARRFLEASARTIPFLALLFIPIALGIPAIYEWSHPEVVAEDALLQHKQPWLNVPFFLVRSVLYLGIWSVIAFLLVRRSDHLDRTDDPDALRRFQQFGGFAMLFVVLTVTFAAFDWLMSLEPHWFSSIFGAIVGLGMIVATFTFTIAVIAALAHREPLHSVATRYIFNDFGSLLLAFLMVWAYLNLSQLLIIWSANIPEEVTWYLHRSEGGWEWLNVLMVIFHFAVPFVVLLSATIRRNSRTLQRLAIFVFIWQAIFLFWLIKPSFATEAIAVHWLDIVAPIALGGIWMALFFWQLGQRPLLPLFAIPELRQRAAEQQQHAH
jgi:hypothetical protein